MISFKNALHIKLTQMSFCKEFEVRDLLYYHFARTAFISTGGLYWAFKQSKQKRL